MDQATTRRQRARSFDRAVDAYERARPSYPDEAVGWLLPAAAHRVLDLGAGTGKLTRVLAARGLDVLAVEPLEAMRTQLSAALPEVRAVAGSAERIPVSDEDVDAVLVAQAWHWFDQDRALPEIARVLRPGGTLGLIWNVRDEQVPWVRELSTLIQTRDATGLPDHGMTVAPYFGEVETREFRHEQPLDRTELLDLVASRSYVITLPDDERAALLAEVRGFTAAHPQLRGRDRFVMPYVTRCYRTRRTF